MKRFPRLTITALFAALIWAAPAAVHPAQPTEENSLAPLLARAERVIAKAHARPLTSARDTPWVVMHAVIAFEKEVRVLDVAAGKKVGGIEFLCRHATYEGKRIFRDAGGQPTLPTRGLSFGLGKSFQVQDHVDQFLMTFADADVSLDEPILAEGGRKFTVGDMLRSSQANVKDDQELGWTLVVATKYLKFSDRWKTAAGKTYRIEDLAALAIRRDASRETEGGPHHLYGVAYALGEYQRRHPGKPAGTWADARLYLERYVALARKYQRPDGSFSAVMFRGSRQASSPRQMVWATGHTIEWLSVAQSAEQLRQGWVRRGVAALVQMMEDHPTDAFSEGGLYHAAHALRRYRDKVGR